jgi:hypothetical protein
MRAIVSQAGEAAKQKRNSEARSHLSNCHYFYQPRPIPILKSSSGYESTNYCESISKKIYLERSLRSIHVKSGSWRIDPGLQ